MPTGFFRTITCVVCGSKYSYDYIGGRIRTKCDSEECDRKRDTRNKRRERDRKKARPSGYRPADYPHHIPGQPEGIREVRRASTAAYRRKKLHARPEGSTYVADHHREDGVNGILTAGHGYRMDDYRDRDKYPLRFIRRSQRDAVKAWFRQEGFPIAGMAGLPLCVSDDPVYIIGRLDNGPSELPPRITRRFCSTDALAPLEPFTMTM